MLGEFVVVSRGMGARMLPGVSYRASGRSRRRPPSERSLGLRRRRASRCRRFVPQRAEKRFGGYSVNRYYDPATAVFVTVDPIVCVTRQAYDYAAEDPVNRYDPNGLTPWSCNHIWEKMLEFTFRNKRPGKVGTHGVLPRYLDLLKHGDLDPGHVQAFENTQASLRKWIRRFKSGHCKPPADEDAQDRYLFIERAARLKAPSTAEINEYSKGELASGGADISVDITDPAHPVIRYHGTLVVIVL